MVCVAVRCMTFPLIRMCVCVCVYLCLLFDASFVIQLVDELMDFIRKFQPTGNFSVGDKGLINVKNSSYIFEIHAK